MDRARFEPAMPDVSDQCNSQTMLRGHYFSENIFKNLASSLGRLQQAICINFNN